MIRMPKSATFINDVACATWFSYTSVSCAHVHKTSYKEGGVEHGVIIFFPQGGMLKSTYKGTFLRCILVKKFIEIGKSKWCRHIFVCSLEEAKIKF